MRKHTKVLATVLLLLAASGCGTAKGGKGSEKSAVKFEGARVLTSIVEVEGTPGTNMASAIHSQQPHWTAN